MTQRKIAKILEQHLNGDKKSSDPYKKAGLARVGIRLDLGNDMMNFSHLNVGDTLPNELLIGRTIVPARTPLTQNHIDNMTFENYLRAANRFDGVRDYNAVLNRHKANHQELLTATTEAPFEVMGRVNETMVRICKSLGLDIRNSELSALLTDSEYNRVRGDDKVAFDKQEFVNKLVEHVVTKAETLLTTDTNAELENHRRNTARDIRRFWVDLAANGTNVSPGAKNEITAAMKKLAYAQSAGSLFRSLKDGKGRWFSDIEHALPKSALNTAVNASKIDAERELMRLLTNHGLRMTNVVQVVDGNEFRLGDLVETAVTQTRGNAVSAIVQEGLDKDRGVTLAFDKKLLEEGDCTLKPEHKKDWKKIEKAEAKAEKPSEYPPISKPPYRGLCQILKMLDHLTKAMTTGFQKTTLAAAWYKRRDKPGLSLKGDPKTDQEREQALAQERGFEWTDIEESATVDLVNDTGAGGRFHTALAAHPELRELREKYVEAVNDNQMWAGDILREIALVVGIVQRQEPAQTQQQQQRTTTPAPAPTRQRMAQMNPKNAQQWADWGANATDEDKKLAGICRLMMQFGRLERINLAFEMDKREKSGSLTAQEEEAFFEKIYANESRQQALDSAKNQISGKSLRTSADKERTVNAAVTSHGNTRTPEQCLAGLSQELRRLSSRANLGNGDAAIRLKVVLGMKPDAPLPSTLIDPKSFVRAQELAAEGDIFAFTSEIDKQRIYYERLVAAEQARQHDRTSGM